MRCRARRSVFRPQTLRRGHNGYPIDVTLVGRYCERYADHAVKVADRLIFLVTGER